MKGQITRITLAKSQANSLLQWIGCQRFIYNAKVQEDRYFRGFKRKSLTHVSEKVPVDQQYSHFKKNAPFLKDVPSQVLRNGAYRWMTGYGRFFQGLGGRPKIKSPHGRQSVLLTSELFQFFLNESGNWFVHIGTKKFKVGNIKVGKDCDLSELPKMIVISVQAGKWFLSFNTPEKDASGEIVQYPEFQDVLNELSEYSDEEIYQAVNGVDRGIAIKACDVKSVINHSLMDENNERIAKKILKRKRYQRKLARQQKGSNRYKRTKRKIARIEHYRANCIKDKAHQASHALTADPSTKVVALEDLNIKNMSKSAKGTVENPGSRIKQKSGLNRSILQSGWGQLNTYLKYKTFKRGKLLVFVPPAHTSQECSQCGYVDSMNRETQSLFVCKACGCKENADLNASGVIANHAAYGIIQHLQAGQELSTRGKMKSQTPVELYVSRDVIKSYRAISIEAGNPHLKSAI